jgi:hypothetical protein
VATEVLKLGVDSKEVKEAKRDLDELNKSAKASEKATDELGKKWNNIGATIGKGASLAAAAVTAAVAAYINYADALDEMSERTGIAASSLAGLEFAAAQSGTSLAKLEQMLGRVSDKAADAASGNKQAASTFRALDIAVTSSNGTLKGQEELLLEISEKFAGYRDGTAKAALAQELFGRGGRELIPLLNKGAAGIEELKQKYRELGGLTDDGASRLNEFNDRLAALQTMAKASTGQFVQGLLPALTEAVTLFENVTKSATGFRDAGNVMGTVIAWLAEMAARGAGAIQALGIAIGASAAAAAMVAKGEFSNALQTMRDMTDEIDALKRKVEQDIATAAALRRQQERGLVGAANEDQNDRAGRRGGQDAPIVARVAAVKKAREEVSEELKELIRDYDDFVVALDRAMNPNYKFETALRKTLAVAKEFGVAQEDVNKVVEYLKDTLDEGTISWKAYQKAIEEGVLERYNDLHKAAIATADDLEKQALALEREAMGLKDVEAQAYATARARAEDALAMAQMSGEASPEYIAELQRQVDALKRLQAAQEAITNKEATQQRTNAQAQAFEDMFQRIDDFAASAWGNIFEGGDNAFKKLAESLKSTLIAALYQLTVRPFVINLVANLTGQAGAAAGMASGGFGGGAGGLGDIFGSLGNLFGGAGGITSSLAGLGGGIGEFFGGFGGFLEGSAGFVGPLAQGSGAMGFLGAAGSMLSTALPYIGAAIAIASAFGLFDESTSRKVGGYAASTGVNVNENENRWFTPNDFDSKLQKVVKATEDSYKNVVGSLGGTAGDFGFAVGFDTNPDGDAPNRAHIGSWVNGKQVYNYDSGEGIGRDAEALQAIIDLETKRALLAAVQASELPADIAAILNQITASAASAEEIDNIIATAQAFKGLSDFFKDYDLAADVADYIEAATMSSTEQMSAMGQALRELAAEYDGSLEATEALTLATGEYYSSLVQMLAQIQSLRESIGNMFDNTGESLLLQTLTDEEKYARYQQQAADLRSQLATANSPEEVEAITRKINDLVQAAFGLLSPEEQQAVLAEQLRLLDEVQAEADARLAEIAETIQEEGERTLESINGLLTAFIADLQAQANTTGDAAATQAAAAAAALEAARINLRAAQTPLVITIDDPTVNA